MDEIYEHNGQKYVVSPERKQDFLAKHPGAKLSQSEAPKINTQQPDRSIRFMSEGTLYDVSESKVQDFMNKNPNANMIDSYGLRSGYEKRDFEEAQRRYSEQQQAAQKETYDQQDEARKLRSDLDEKIQAERDTLRKTSEDLSVPGIWEDSVYAKRDALAAQIESMPEGQEKYDAGRVLFGMDMDIDNQFAPKQPDTQVNLSNTVNKNGRRDSGTYIIENGKRVNKRDYDLYTSVNKDSNPFDSIPDEKATYYIVTSPDGTSELWDQEKINTNASWVKTRPEEYIKMMEVDGYSFSRDGSVDYKSKETRLSDIPESIKNRQGSYEPSSVGFSGTSGYIASPTKDRSGYDFHEIITDIKSKIRDAKNPEEKQRIIELAARDFDGDEEIETFLSYLKNPYRFKTEDEAISSLVPEFDFLSSVRDDISSMLNEKEEERRDILYKMKTIANRAEVTDNEDERMSLSKAYNSVYKTYIDKQKEFSDLADASSILNNEVGYISDEISDVIDNVAIDEAGKLEYSNLARFGNSVADLWRDAKKFSINTWAEASNPQAPRMGTSPIDNGVSREVEDRIYKSVRELANEKIIEIAIESEEERAKFSREMTLDEIGEYSGDSADYVLESFTSNGASHVVSASMFLAGPAAGLAVPSIFGATTYGRTYGDLLLENKRANDYLEKLKEERSKVADDEGYYLDDEIRRAESTHIYSQGEMANAALLDGAIEGGLTFGSGALFRSSAMRKAGGKLLSSISKGGERRLLSELILNKNVNQLGLKALEIGLIENAEELSIAALQGYGTRGLYLGKDVGEKEVFGEGGFGDFIAKNSINSLLMGGGVSTASTLWSIGADSASKSKLKSNLLKIISMNKEIETLQEQMRNSTPGTQEYGLLLGELNSLSKDHTKISKHINATEVLSQNAIASLANLSKQEISEVANSVHEQKKILREVDRLITANEEMGGKSQSPVFAKKIQDLSNRYKELTNKKDVTLKKSKTYDGSNVELDPESQIAYDSFFYKKGAFLAAEGDTMSIKPSDELGSLKKIIKEAVENPSELNDSALLKIKENIKRIISSQDSYSNLSEDGKKSINQAIDNYTIENLNNTFNKAGGEYIGGVAMVIDQNVFTAINSKKANLQQKLNAADTPFHEFAHGLMGKMDSKHIIDLANESIRFLDDENTIKRLEDRYGKEKADQIVNDYRSRINLYRNRYKGGNTSNLMEKQRVFAEEMINIVNRMYSDRVITDSMIDNSSSINSFVTGIKKSAFGKLFAAGSIQADPNNVTADSKRKELLSFLKGIDRVANRKKAMSGKTIFGFSKPDQDGGKRYNFLDEDGYYDGYDRYEGELDDYNVEEYDGYQDLEEDSDVLLTQYEEDIIDLDTYLKESSSLTGRKASAESKQKDRYKEKSKQKGLTGEHKTDLRNEYNKYVEEGRKGSISNHGNINDILLQMIKNYSARYNSKLKNEDIFHNDVLDDYRKYIDSFDDSKNDDFFGWVNANLYNRIKNLGPKYLRTLEGRIGDEGIMDRIQGSTDVQTTSDFSDDIVYEFGKISKDESNINNSQINPLNMFKDDDFKAKAENEIRRNIKESSGDVFKLANDLSDINDKISLLESEYSNPKTTSDKRAQVDTQLKDVYSKRKDIHDSMNKIVNDIIYSSKNNFAAQSIADKLGIPAERLTKKSDYLRGDGKTGDEMDVTAKALYDLADDILKIMPEFNMALTGVSEGAKGAMNIAPLVLKNFYAKSGFVGEGRLSRTLEGNKKPGSSGNPLQKLIPTNKTEFLSKLGITEDGKSRPGVKRGTPEANARMAMIREIGRFMTNTEGRLMLQEARVPHAFVVDTRAGMNAQMLNELGVDVSDVDLSNVETALKFLSSKDVKILLGYGQQNMIREYENATVEEKINLIEKLAERLSWHEKRKGLQEAVRIQIEDGLFDKFKNEFGYEGSKDDFFNAYLDAVDTHFRDESKRNVVAEKVLDILSRDKRAFVSDKLDLVPRLKHILGIYGGDNSNAATEKVRNKLLEGKEAPTEYGKRFIQEINRLHNLLPKLRNSFYSNTVASDTNEELQKWMNGEYKSEREIRRKLKSISRDGAKANIAKDNLHKLIFTSLHENLNNSKTAQEYIDNLSYITALFSDNWKGFDSNNWKRVSTLKRGAGIISSKTLKGYRGHNKNSKAAGYFVRIEHLNPASKQNIAFQKYAITGKMPNMSMRYDSAVMDNEYALAADSKKINFYINSDKTITIRAQNIVGNRESDAWQMAQNDGGAQRLNSIEDLDLNEDLNNETQMTSEESFIDTTMSNILKQATSIPASEQVSESAARLNAERRKKKFRRLAPSADDFAGLWYSFLGKGKVGDAQIAFFNKYLTEPLNKAYVAMTHARQEITRNYKDLNKEYEDIKKSLNKKSGVGKFTNDQAVRAYLYTKNGESISTLGLTQSEADALNNVVKSNPRMLEYADYLLEIVANDGNWVPSKPKWTLGSIVEDVERVIADTKRAQYLSEWKRNADIIFSKNNLNKIESHYGTFFRKALEDSLYRIEKGKAIPENTSKEMSEFQKWMSGAVSVTMFLNRRSALLQLMSLTNYVNWGDNNPMMAAKAFADIGQYSKDFVRIFNSDYLRERRGGLKTEVEAAVLANELRKSGADGYRGFVNKLLQKGFTLTQIGDSLAISLGGATFYRNRKNTYLKQGMSEREAHDRAWLDFVEATEVSQQSARPDKLSSQQTSGLGRFLLTFQNTPMQYFRIFDKSVSNLVNRRGDPKEHISKILYYTFVAGAIFSYLQQALFAFGDDDEEDEKYTAEKQKRETRVINSTLDTMLKGSGIYGAYMSTLKNVIIEFISQEEKGYKADHTRTFIEALNLAPPLGIKARKLYQGAYMNYKYNNEIMGDMGFDIDNPAYDVGGSLVSAGLNIPADEVINDIRSIKEAFDSQHDAWQRVALLLGYSTWNLGIPNEKIDFLKDRNTQRKLDAAKDKRAKERAIKNKEKEAAKKKKEKEKEAIANKKRKTTGLPKMSGLPKTTGLPKS